MNVAALRTHMPCEVEHKDLVQLLVEAKCAPSVADRHANDFFQYRCSGEATSTIPLGQFVLEYERMLVFRMVQDLSGATSSHIQKSRIMDT